MTLLTSPQNPRIKQIRALRQRKTRVESGLFLVEGIRHVGEAIQARARVAYICYSPAQLSSDFAQELVETQAAQGIPCLAVAPEVFEGLADKENPQGILAVVHQPRYDLAQITPANFSWGVALVSPQDPGNIGAILRTIDAVGASGLFLLDESADPFHPGAVRASMGAIFGKPVLRLGFTEFMDWSRKHAYCVYGTSAHGSQDYRQAGPFRPPCILLMGSERQGLSAEQAAACNALLRMPMHGRVTSLNLAVATGVMLYRMLEDMEG